MKLFHFLIDLIIDAIFNLNFFSVYDTSLEDAIKGDETGTLQRLLVSLSTVSTM